MNTQDAAFTELADRVTALEAAIEAITTLTPAPKPVTAHEPQFMDLDKDMGH